MKPKEIKLGIYSVGAADCPRQLFDALIPNLKVEVLGTVLARSFPEEADFTALDKLAEAIAQTHRENSFV